MSICWQWGRRFPWLADDFLSDASVNLWRAFVALDRDLAGVTAGFAATVVKRAIWGRLQKEHRTNPLAFHPQPLIVSDEGKSIDVVTTIPAAESVDRLELAELVEVARASGQELDFDLLTRHVNGATLDQLAAEMGYSRARIGQRIARARRQALEALQAAGCK